MRASVLLVAVLTLGALLTEASTAQADARASASAAVVTGTPGDSGSVSVRDDGRRSERASVEERAISLVGGQAVVTASRALGVGSSRASGAARTVSVFDGLVTAYGVRRTVRAADGEQRFTGRVRGLRIDGRMIGNVRSRREYDLGGAGTVTVNDEGAGITVTLTRSLRGFAAGSTVTVVDVRASARDGADPDATPTPAATEAPTPSAAPDRTPRARRSAPSPRRTRRTRRPAAPVKRRRAPTVPRRLTVQRFAFPVFGSKGPVPKTFGAPRQKTGRHQGNDIFAPFGSPVLAVTDGEVFKVGTPAISGNRLWLRSEAGDEFFYAHLSAFSPAAVNGRRVKAGQVLGFTGNTGDAEPTPPHVHFEIHPGAGDAIDPNPILEAWRLKRDVPPGVWLTRYGTDTEQRPGALVEIRDFIAGE